MATVHHIDAAHEMATEEPISVFEKVDGKENILFRIADAALAEPTGVVSDVVFGAVTDGEQTLRELVRDYETKRPVYRRTVRATLKKSYTSHYRRGMTKLLDALQLDDQRAPAAGGANEWSSVTTLYRAFTPHARTAEPTACLPWPG